MLVVLRRGLRKWCSWLVMVLIVCALFVYAVAIMYVVVQDLGTINSYCSRLQVLYGKGNISEVDYLRYSTSIISTRDSIFLTFSLVTVVVIQSLISLALFTIKLDYGGSEW